MRATELTKDFTVRSNFQTSVQPDATTLKSTELRRLRPSWRSRNSWWGWSATLLFSALQLAACAGCGTLGGLPMSVPGLVPSTTVPVPAKPTQAIDPNQADSAARLPNLPVVPAAFTQTAAVNASSPSPVIQTQCLDDCSFGASSACVNSGAEGCYGGCATSDCGCGVSENFGVYRNAQEYIFDGGDQQPLVVVKQDYSAVGIDPTDTVAYYETLEGSVCVRPTNRVPIYAPRFGAVRQVSGLQLSTHAAGTERMLAPIKPGRFDETNLASTVVLPLAPYGEQQVGLIDAFQDNYRGTPMDQVLPLERLSSARVPFEGMNLFRTGLITLAEVTEIQQFIQNAQTWVNPESIAIEVSGQAAILVKDTKAAQDVYVYDLPDKCSLRICKAASHTIANSGDIVSFTIRFDNAGVKPVGNVVILDSLSPRLDYIEGSQQCSVGVRFSSEPNDVGSMVLKWEIENPIEPSDGGAISFDCRVR